MIKPHWATVVVVLVALSMAGYFVFVKHVEVGSGPSNQNIKTYRNDKFGFEFQYPSNWELAEDQGDNLDVHLSGEDSYPSNKFIGMEIQASLPIDSGKSFEQFVKDHTNLPDMSPGGKIEEISIGGHKAFKTEWSGGEGWNGPGYFIQKDEKSYIFIFTGWGGKADPQILNQILSTFQFLEAPSISNWKTYQNDKQGFSLQYPPALQLRTSYDISGYFDAQFSGSKSTDTKFGLQVDYGDPKINGILAPESFKDCVEAKQTIRVDSLLWTLGNYTCGQGGPDDFTKAAFIKRGSQIFLVLALDVDYLKQVLSTIKFNK